MTDEILFTERQRFRQWWLWLILPGINGLFLFEAFKQIIRGQSFGSSPVNNTGILIAAGLTIFLTLLFRSLRPDARIKTDGIYVRFFPFHLKFRYYSRERPIKIFVRRYAPLAEYGGRGLRFGSSGRGTAYNVSGNKGLQPEISDHKKLLIETNRPDELKEVLNKPGRLKP